MELINTYSCRTGALKSFISEFCSYQRRFLVCNLKMNSSWIIKLTGEAGRMNCSSGVCSHNLATQTLLLQITDLSTLDGLLTHNEAINYTFMK